MGYTITDRVTGKALTMDEVLDKIEAHAVDIENASLARRVIKQELERRREEIGAYNMGFSVGLSYALGAFSGVCEEGERV